MGQLAGAVLLEFHPSSSAFLVKTILERTKEALLLQEPGLPQLGWQLQAPFLGKVRLEVVSWHSVCVKAV